jgi:hypothetical protein
LGCEAIHSRCYFGFRLRDAFWGGRRDLPAESERAALPTNEATERNTRNVICFLTGIFLGVKAPSRLMTPRISDDRS